MIAANEAKANSSVDGAFQLVHEILVLDALLLRPLDSERYEAITRAFVNDLLRAMGMEALGELGIYPALDQREPGWSFLQPITTSHVGAHYFENPGLQPHIRVDAYSCMSIDWTTLIRICHEHFALDRWRASFIDRQLEHPGQRKVIELAGRGARVTSEILLVNRNEQMHGENQ